jgi:hypothetical protein
VNFAQPRNKLLFRFGRGQFLLVYWKLVQSTHNLVKGGRGKGEGRGDGKEEEKGIVEGEKGREEKEERKKVLFSFWTRSIPYCILETGTIYS